VKGSPEGKTALADLLFARVKSSLEDYQSQSGGRITKKLIRDAVDGMNDDNLPSRDLRAVRERLDFMRNGSL